MSGDATLKLNGVPTYPMAARDEMIGVNLLA